MTVAPTQAGPVLIGWDDEGAAVRRLPDPGVVAVTGRVTSVRATVGEDVTVLSDIPIATARVVGDARGRDRGRRWTCCRAST